MRFGFPRRARLLLVPASAVLLFVMAGCGNSSIVGKWRMSGTENQTVWEFSGNGSVLVGEVRGRYKFGDQDRIKIETPFATTVYLVKLSSDQLVLQDLGGSKLEFTRVRETPRRLMRTASQNSALPGVRAKGITSRMFEMPVMNISMRSKPRPKPECGTVP